MPQRDPERYTQGDDGLIVAKVGLSHLPVLLPDEILDAGLPSLSRIEGANAFVDFRAQCAQLFDLGEQGLPDLFLTLGGQALDFGYGLFKCFDHHASISNRSA
jgi:hypothetical protein